MNNRKARLLGVALCRRIYDLMLPDSQIVVDLVEKFADKLVTRQELDKINQLPRRDDFGAYKAASELFEAAYAEKAEVYCLQVMEFVNSATQKAGSNQVFDYMYYKSVCVSICPSAEEKQVNLPEITDLMINLAKTMYENNDFSDIPILHDLFEDVGADKILLEHLKNPLHFPGDWLIDRILDK